MHPSPLFLDFTLTRIAGSAATCFQQRCCKLQHQDAVGELTIFELLAQPRGIESSLTTLQGRHGRVVKARANYFSIFERCLVRFVWAWERRWKRKLISYVQPAMADIDEDRSVSMPALQSQWLNNENKFLILMPHQATQSTMCIVNWLGGSK